MALKRKLIDVEEETFRLLSIKAATSGVSLKKYIESVLSDDVADLRSSTTIKKLLSNAKEIPEEKSKRGRKPKNKA